MNIGRFFEDFHLGEQIVHATPRTISDGDCALYIALTGSRYVLHCCQPLAMACGFRATPVDQMLVFHIAFGKTVPDVSLNAVANLGYAEVLFMQPVYVGDTLFVSSNVIGLKENSSGKTGIVYVHSTAKNQFGDTVLSWKRWVMVHKRYPEAITGYDSVPAVKTQLTVDELVPHATQLPDEFYIQSGSQKHAKDYRVGEIILHGGGMTLADADHMMATRLYQNNARVHFDAQFMRQQASGQRLVYGGHIMSLCRAMAHQHLENAFWIAGFNSGAHTQPSFSNDTISCVSRIVEVASLSSSLGALRINSLGLKNSETEPTQLNIEALWSTDARHNKNIVLNWDYWVLMPN